jgi:hypothetical protein
MIEKKISSKIPKQTMKKVIQSKMIQPIKTEIKQETTSDIESILKPKSKQTNIKPVMKQKVNKSNPGK